MTKLSFSGPLSLRLKSLLTLNRIALATYARHAIGRRMAPDWDAALEIGIRFWRHQFTAALNASDIRWGRLLFDSLQTETNDVYDVEVEDCARPKGRWYRPQTLETGATLLYFHGGGYTFHGRISERFAAMLAHRLGANLFAPDYRLTPEHPHPAQQQDALAAWSYVAGNVPADRLVVIGDSAGGHMALTLLQSLRAQGLAQPALCIGLCPWTDIGDRDDSLHAHDEFDLVQGWMAVRFGQWLDPGARFGRATLSPVCQDFSGLAPIYLQAGGREILHDMIAEFARLQQAKGADVTLDVWPDMPHDFQAYDSFTASSTAALIRLKDVIGTYAGS